MTSKLQLLPPDIKERLKELPARVASLDGLTALWLFGSFARGEATPISDVDFAYLPEAALHGDALEPFETRLYRRIAETLHTDEFTFTNLSRVPAHFASQVLKEGHLVYCRNELPVAALLEEVYRSAPDLRWLRQAGNACFLEGFGMAERSIDKERVTDFLRLINADVGDLREKLRTPGEVYLRNRDAQAVVERRLQTATESCLNVGNHLIARLGLRAPQDYGDVFHILEEVKILPIEVTEQMVKMARFRNLLVHVYWEIDPKRVYESLPARLAALEGFVKHLVRWLKTNG